MSTPEGTETEDRTVKVVELAGTRAVSVGEQCFADGRPSDERRVQVALERTSNIQAVLYSATVTLDTTSVVHFERGL